jgi:hypothetical protein
VKSLLGEALGDAETAKRIGYIIISSIVLASLILLGLLVIIHLQRWAEGVKVIQDNFEPTREELKGAMRYHGILYAEMDKNGEWYFVRDGKRCRLFTYAYKEK